MRRRCRQSVELRQMLLAFDDKFGRGQGVSEFARLDGDARRIDGDKGRAETIATQIPAS